MDLLRHVRMWEAHRLLALGALPPGEVAERVGIPSYSTFSRAFRAKFGISPAAVRKRIP
jgi:AraC-like DNA-binding protein